MSQIVFHKGYCDPNFENRNFHIDTSLLLDDIVEKTKAKRQNVPKSMKRNRRAGNCQTGS
ncbi:hypothetical protein DOY81_009648 [Sarcophaga bullata]|nr:hypothetical protein DOY81_009648 [Sarcophaga bullata]